MAPAHRPRRRPRSAIQRLLTSATALLALSSSPLVNADTGGQYCSTTLCINAVVDASNTVTYQLKSTLGFNSLGWMAIGFGTQMPDSPMCIVWPNEDGTITLSQRQSTGHIMPVVVPNPAQVAELAWENSILATDTTTIAFKLPAPSGSLSAVDMIYAYASIRPGSSSPDATLQQHDDSGTFVMDLTTPGVSALPTGVVTTAVFGTVTSVGVAHPTNTPTSGVNGGNSVPIEDDNLPLTPSEKTMRTHGVLMCVGYLILLPLGVFIARFSRTVPFLAGKWFTAHWFVQLVLSAPIIIAGWILAYDHVRDEFEPHFRDQHTKVGLALLILYLIQMLYGALIHFVKPKPKGVGPAPVGSPAASGTTAVPNSPEKTTAGGSKVPLALSPAYHPNGSPSNRYPAITGRPIQNYGHAILGLTIIGLAFHNAREGFKEEWLVTFGERWEQNMFLRRINAWWVAWVIIIPCIYVLGLTLLPRQWKMETAYRRQLWDEQHGAAPGGQQPMTAPTATTTTKPVEGVSEHPAPATGQA